MIPRAKSTCSCGTEVILHRLRKKGLWMNKLLLVLILDFVLTILVASTRHAHVGASPAPLPQDAQLFGSVSK